jgi:hypothetical protein
MRNLGLRQRVYMNALRNADYRPLLEPQPRKLPMIFWMFLGGAIWAFLAWAIFA